jgi:pimeloyl-ACP methyl ester carboxylesterase
VHGFPEFWYAWKNQLTEFGKDHKAVAVDMRGYNLSSKPTEVDQYRVGVVMEDIRALAEKLGYKKFILVGHDWGGGVAWSFAIAHPEYLQKLIIINAPHPAIFARELRENPLQQKASEYMIMFRGPGAEAALSADNFAALVKGVALDFSEEEKEIYIEAWSQPGALTGGLNYYRAARLGPPASGSDQPAGSFDPSRFVVHVPTLVIWGEKDRFLLTGNLKGMDAFVPELTIKRVPDATHWVIREKPQLVNSYIREFISR